MSENKIPTKFLPRRINGKWSVPSSRLPMARPLMRLLALARFVLMRLNEAARRDFSIREIEAIPDSLLRDIGIDRNYIRRWVLDPPEVANSLIAACQHRLTMPESKCTFVRRRAGHCTRIRAAHIPRNRKETVK